MHFILWRCCCSRFQMHFMAYPMFIFLPVLMRFTSSNCLFFFCFLLSFLFLLLLSCLFLCRPNHHFFSYLNSFLILLRRFPRVPRIHHCVRLLFFFISLIYVCSYFAKVRTRVSALAFNRFKSVEFRRFNFTTYTQP